MDRIVPVLVAALLLASAPVAAAISFQHDAALSGGSADARSLQAGDLVVVRGLHLVDPGTSNVTAARSDTTALLDVQASGLHGQFRVYRLQERMRSVSSRDAQIAVLSRTLANVSERIDELKSAERRVRLAYVRGEMNSTAFVTALARISAKAGHTGATLTYVREHLGDTFPQFIREHLRPLQPELRALQGPVRAHAAAVLRGEVRPNRLYVAASANGTTLAMIQGRTLVSQTTRWDNFDPAVHSVSDAGTAIHSTLNETYPALRPGQTTSRRYNFIGSNSALFRTGVRFDYGRAIGYYDGSTDRLFYEEMELFLNSVPGGHTEQRLENNRVVTVNRTYPGGPLQVRLTNRTGAPLDGTVKINGEEVGRTGAAGSLWALGRSGTYTVTVVHEGHRVEMRVTAVRTDG